MHANMNADGVSTLWLHTPAIHDRRSLRAFQEDFSQFLGGTQIEPVHEQPLAVRGSLTVFGTTVLAMGETSPSRCIHPHQQPPEDEVMLLGWPQAQCTLQAGGQTLDLSDGDVVLSCAGLTQTVVNHIPGRLCAVSLSRAMLGDMRVDVDAMLLHPLHANPAAAMLMAYARLLRDQDLPPSPELRHAATVHLHDLAALAAGAAGDAAHQALGRGARAARLSAVKQAIAQQFTRPGLSAAEVARHQGISPRYLHKLLEAEGMSFSALVSEHRLNLAMHMLSDARLKARAISDIAFDVGFNDLSHFNHRFRQRFGMTPTQARLG